MVSRQQYYALEDEHDMFEGILIQLKFKFAKVSAELEDVTQDMKTEDGKLQAKNATLAYLQEEMMDMLQEKQALEEALGYASKTSHSDCESNSSTKNSDIRYLTDR